jgi:hypothetical protein
MLPLLPYILRILSDSSNPAGRAIAWILRAYPAFAFGEGLLNVGSANVFAARENNNVTMSPFDLDIGLGAIIYLAIGSVLFFALLLIIEKLLNKESFMRCFSRSEAQIDETESAVEDDVRKER